MATFSKDDRVEIRGARCLRMRKQADGTPTAILVTAPQFDEPTWIPWSHVDDESPVWRIGDQGTVIVSLWLAEKRGWARGNREHLAFGPRALLTR